ncbi:MULTISPECIES: hypothetical protein [unclassified Thermococcus]|uniref:hypothetical protein n=1 Tax=unclassified Thermococcus TaxID=2627626 RepID=UPI00130DD715|nr:MULTISPECIES: hypothetical protein [unclassified Thermococcus]HIH71951.1 hypothetical protein [Thermococcaceae archaeon]
MICVADAKQEAEILELVKNIVETKPEFNYSQIPPLCAGRQCNSRAWSISGF